MSNRKLNLVKNTAIYALGSIGSKLLQVILVPYYTRAMSSTEFGTADILQAIVAFLFPIVSLSIFDATFRYAMESDCDKNSVLSVGVAISLIGTVILCSAGALITLIHPIEYLWLIIFNALANAFRTLYSQYTRAIGKTALFTLDNVLLTVYVLIFNIFFISVLELGVTGYMLGYTLANALSAVFLMLKLKKLAVVKFSFIKSRIMSQMLRFSIPLIPNALCWCLATFGSRFLITFFIDESANGLYAAAYKIPSLLSVIVTIFFQAWQISANEEFKKNDIAEFYTEIHNQIFALIVIISSGLIVFCKPITAVFLGAEYQNEWVYIPILLIAMAFLSFSQFLESIYTANKKTVMAFITSFISVSINMTLSLFLIKPLGVAGCAVALAVSYFVLWICRIINTHKIIAIRYNIATIVTAILILTAQTLLFFFRVPFASLVSSVGFVVLIILFANTFKGLFLFAIDILRKIFKKEA